MKNYLLFSTRAFTVAFLLTVPLKAQEQAHDHAHEPGHIHNHSHFVKERPRTSQKTPSRGDVLWQQAENAWHIGNHDDAIKSYYQLIEIEPDNIDAYSNAAWLIWSAGRSEEAANLMRQGTRRNPHSWEFWYGAGDHFFLQKREPKATQVFFERALALRPRGHKRWLNLRRLAFAAERAGNPTRAIQAWKRTLLETPKDAIAQRKLRELQAQLVKTTSTR